MSHTLIRHVKVRDLAAIMVFYLLSHMKDLNLRTKEIEKKIVDQNVTLFFHMTAEYHKIVIVPMFIAGKPIISKT